MQGRTTPSASGSRTFLAAPLPAMVFDEALRNAPEGLWSYMSRRFTKKADRCRALPYTY